MRGVPEWDYLIPVREGKDLAKSPEFVAPPPGAVCARVVLPFGLGCIGWFTTIKQFTKIEELTKIEEFTKIENFTKIEALTKIKYFTKMESLFLS